MKSGKKNKRKLAEVRMSTKASLKREFAWADIAKDTAEMFWSNEDVQKEFPRLFRLAEEWLCVSTSSASVERSFSVLKTFRTPNRSQMDDAYVEMELTLRFNRSLLYEFLHTVMEK